MSMTNPSGNSPEPATTHFGFQSVPEGDKARRVKAVFDSVAPRYDLMNDLMSLGLHRVWKAIAISQAAIRPGQSVLDLASGTGDLALAMAPRIGPTGQLVMTDINPSMLARGRDRLLDAGYPVTAMVCDAEQLPFEDASFDRVTLAFGLRNMTHKDKALEELFRVLRPGGKGLILEFSKVLPPFEKLYDHYSFKVLPSIGRWVTGDAQSYRYLAESIRMHPGPQELAELMRQAGFGVVRYQQMSAGVVAIHQGVKTK
jgi:demethylmenaquinone methyltransferase/2-methoxy-6-polyprenyl-1,4-benzoquinol methylase